MSKKKLSVVKQTEKDTALTMQYSCPKLAVMPTARARCLGGWGDGRECSRGPQGPMGGCLSGSMLQVEEKPELKQENQ